MRYAARRMKPPPSTRSPSYRTQACPGAGSAGSEKPKDNVVDAEFVDVDDKK